MLALICFAGWGNAELQCYTDNAANARVEPTAGGDGKLVLEATYSATSQPCYNGPNLWVGSTQVRCIACNTCFHPPPPPARLLTSL